jgi:hypothetical protein
LIRFKAIRKVYPNGLTWADYHLEDAQQEAWYEPVRELIQLIKSESPAWGLIFRNFLSSLKSSVFYPVVTSFSDWESSYSQGSALIKFHSQTDAVNQLFHTPFGPYTKPIYPSRAGRGSRWLFADQMNRVGKYDNPKLLELLHAFSMTGGAIPTAGWENNMSYGRRIGHFASNYAEYLLSAA